MASKRHLRRRSCSSKRRFDTQEDAAKSVRVLRRLGRLEGWIVTYRCRFCNGYHYGHPPASVRQSIAASNRRKGPKPQL